MLWWALLPLGLLAALPFAAEALRKPMDDGARRTAPGRFARLSDGITHYRWHGPEAGPVVVCVHGLTTPCFVWEGLARGLADAGFRVLAYDLFGRGYSDRPRGAQSTRFFVRQLEELLDDQGVRDPVALIGYSMGGVIATAFAAAQPDRTGRMVLLAPAGMHPLDLGRLGPLLRLPFIGRWAMLARYPAILRRGLAEEADLPGSVPGINAMQAAELARRGFVPSVHESLRGALAENMHPMHHALAGAGLPMLAIWGARDAVIPLSARDTLHSWNPAARQRVIDGAGHGLPYTHTADTLAGILPFLRETG